MSEFFYLEFYVRKAPLDTEMISSLIEAMNQNGLQARIDETHMVLFGNDSRTRIDEMSFEEMANLSLEETIQYLVQEGGGSLPFEGQGDLFPFSLRLYPLGSPGHQRRAQRLGDSESGTVPLGSVDISWPFMGGDDLGDLIDQNRFAKTISVGTSLYRAISPIFGFSYLNEVWDPEYFKLIPTEKNILNVGPRDVFHINFWSPEISQRIDWDWDAISALTGLVVVRLDDGGVLIHCSAEDFVRNKGVEKRERLEELLGWRNKAA